MKSAIHSISVTTTVALITVLGLSFSPSISSAQSRSHQASIVEFKDNVEALDVLAKKMVNQAKLNSKFVRGQSSDVLVLSKHAELTRNLVKATLIGNPAVLRQATQDVRKSLKELKSTRSKTKKIPGKIDKLIKASSEPSDYVINKLNDFNIATSALPVSSKVIVEEVSDKPIKPGSLISKLLKSLN